jgi:hypothetical protein
MTKKEMVARAINTQLAVLKSAVSYGVGTQPDRACYEILDGQKAEIRAFSALLAGDTDKAKKHMTTAEVQYDFARRLRGR